ncbi:unnamed protein product [Parnassius apollo]|uniref:(apollo) hypothetical protein n=1 Tax=Parnassius apollo TaxID=110799 RepID=A0A8S3XQU4_PARAO|nr:unnamed protein product [Parnassius apollo]
MKTITLAFVALLVGVNSLPHHAPKANVKKEKIIDGIVINIIERIAEHIQGLGLDPLVIDKFDGEYTFPVDGIFSGSVSIENFESSGLSNIVVNEVSFKHSTLSFDISLPSIDSFIGDVSVEVHILRRKLFGEGSGRLNIKDLRFAGQVTIGSEKLIKDLNLAFSLGDIESDLHVNILGYDISNRLNEYLGKTLPSQLKKYEEKLNRVLANFILKVLDRLFYE